MTFKQLIIALLLLTGVPGALRAQTPKKVVDPLYDTTIVDYDDLFNELEKFLDSLTTPRSYYLLNVSAGRGFYNYTNRAGTGMTSNRQLNFNPSIGYYDKGGLGLNAGVAVVKEGEKLNPYQVSLTLSYDYLQSRKFIGGSSFTHFFTKDSLPFYTSPLQNELFAYASYRDSWLKPTVSASYGWGSRKEVEERQEKIKKLRLRTTTVVTEESVSDFNLTASVRHDFYWLNVLTNKDFIRISPQLSFTSGTQQFGFNQSTATTSVLKGKGNDILYESNNTTLSDEMKFQPLSLAAILKSELSLGKFFIQPQMLVDYYFPAPEKNVTASFRLNTGFVF